LDVFEWPRFFFEIITGIVAADEHLDISIILQAFIMVGMKKKLLTKVKMGWIFHVADLVIEVVIAKENFGCGWKFAAWVWGWKRVIGGLCMSVNG